MNWKHVVVGITTAVLLGAGSRAQAQPAAPAGNTPFSVEVGIGFDNSISGNINSSGIGHINNQTTVITKNKYEDVYGTGLHLRFGGAYELNDMTEVTATFAFQSLDADLVKLGEIGASNLYGQYADYQSFGLDFGLRRYKLVSPAVRAYAEGAIGIAFVDEVDVTLVAPQANVSGIASDFYDRTAAFTLAAHVGVLVKTGNRMEAFGQMGLRGVTGMSEVDGLAGTGLETINDHSSRWTLPFIAGVRVRF